MSARAVVVGDEAEGARADVVVARALGLSVREARDLFAGGAVTRGGRRIAKGERVAVGEVLHVVEPSLWHSPLALPDVRVVFEDASVVVVDKPAGVPSHPLVRGEGGTAADAVVAACPSCAAASPDAREGGLVHRLDTFTSGLLAAARSRPAWEELRAAFTEGAVVRGYLALVDGELEGPLDLRAPIAHDAGDERRMVVADETASVRGQPKPARTRVRPLATAAGVTLVAVRTEGGRRHQVRVHLASAGFPLVGDALYGGSPARHRAGHLLHAAWLELPSRPPLVAALPADFLEELRGHGFAPSALERAMEGGHVAG